MIKFKYDLFQANNMVMAAKTNTKLCLPSIYTLLTIVHVELPKPSTPKKPRTPKPGAKTKTRIKIPYFGTEGILVAVRFNNMSRGIRKDGGQLRNVVAVDLQYADKNIHLKISEHKVTLMGARNESMGLEAMNLMLEHLVMVNEHWQYIQELDESKRVASMNWLAEVIYIPENDRKKDSDIRCNSDLKSYDDPVVQEALNNIPSTVDSRMITFLSMFLHEYTIYEEFRQKVQSILELKKPIYQQLPKLGTARIHNSVYVYNIGREVSFIELGKGLTQKGYNVCYHNVVKSELFRIIMPIEDDDMDNPGKVERQCRADGQEYKERAHKFCLYHRGTIRQSSPTTHKMAMTVMEKLVTDIIGIDNESKQAAIASNQNSTAMTTNPTTNSNHATPA